jgi:hypothetical protein
VDRRSRHGFRRCQLRDRLCVVDHKVWTNGRLLPGYCARPRSQDWYSPRVLPIALLAQNPYTAAGDHYHLVFENAWAQATRVTYAPHEGSPVQEHPATPTTVYIYTTDGGVMRFHRMTGDRVAGVTVDRPPVKAGAIRFARGAARTMYSQYVRDYVQ